VLLEQISDRLPIFATFKLPMLMHTDNEQLNSQFKTVRSMSHANMKSLCSALLATDWSFITDNSNVNDDFNNFFTVLSSLIIKHLPMRRVIIKADKKTWLTLGLRASCKTKNKLYKLVIAGKYPKKEYIAYRNKVTKLLCLSKANHSVSIINHIPQNSAFPRLRKKSRKSLFVANRGKNHGI
jgi:hypothetical protein